jgi:hypothetical protein
MSFWDNPWVYGVGSNIIVWWLTRKWERAQKPTADEIGEANLRAQHRLADSQDLVAVEAGFIVQLFLVTIDQHIAMFREGIVPPPDFAKPFETMLEQWMALEERVRRILNRDDIRDEGINLLRETNEIYERIAQEQKNYQKGISQGLPLHRSRPAKELGRTHYLMVDELRRQGIELRKLINATRTRVKV